MHKMCEQILALILSTAMAVSIIPMHNVRAAEQTKEEASASDEMQYERIDIASPEQFADFASKCFIDSWSKDKYVSLKTDIDLAGTEINSIPVFNGIFDGVGHTISGFDCQGDGYVVGLFRYVEREGVIQNLTLKGDITSENEQECIGSIAGINHGTIKNCTFQGTVSGRDTVGGIAGINERTGIIAGCSVKGRITGYYATGGIVGINHGALNYCTNRAGINDDSAWVAQDDEMGTGLGIIESLTADEDSALYSGVDTGGIAGFSDGVISRCTNHGIVGYEHTGYNIGGIVGRQSGIVSLSINQGTVYGRKDIGGIVGQMEPYIEINEAESLRNAINKLHDLVEKTIDDMDAAGDGIKSDVDVMQSYADSAIDSGDELVTQITDFTDNNVEEINSVTGRMEHIIDLLPDILDDVSDAGNAMNGLNDVAKQLSKDLDVLGKLDDSSYNEMDYNRLTLLSTVGGTVTTDSANPAANETVTITVKPDEGYQLKEGSLTVTDKKGKKIAISAVSDQENQYTFVMPKANVKIKAEFVYKGAFLVKSTAGGRVTTTQNGSQVTFKASASGGYQFDSFQVNGNAYSGIVTADHEITLDRQTDIKDNTSTVVEAIFTKTAASVHQITVRTGTGGTAYVTGGNTAAAGENVTVHIAARPNYQYKEMRVNGSRITPTQSDSDASEWIFIMPDSNAEVEVLFQYQYDSDSDRRIYAESNAGGTATATKASDGASYTITIVPEEGYDVSEQAALEFQKLPGGTASEQETAENRANADQNQQNEMVTDKENTENGSEPKHTDYNENESSGDSIEIESSDYKEPRTTEIGSTEIESSEIGTTEIGTTEIESTDYNNQESTEEYSEDTTETERTDHSEEESIGESDTLEMESTLAEAFETQETMLDKEDSIRTNAIPSDQIPKSGLEKGEGARTYKYVVRLESTDPNKYIAYVTFVKKDDTSTDTGTTYNITTVSSTGGSVAADISSAKAGDKVYVTPVSNNGYILNQITVNGETSNLESDGKRYSFTMPDKAVEVIALFEPIDILLKSNFSGDATYSGNAQGKVTLTVKPSGSYTVKSIKVTDAGGKKLSVSRKQSGSYLYEFDITKMSKAPCTVNISFQKQNKEQAVNTSKTNVNDAIDELTQASNQVQKSINHIKSIVQKPDGSYKSWETLTNAEQEAIVTEVLNLVESLGAMSTSASAILSSLTTIYNILAPYTSDAAKAARNDLEKATNQIQDMLDALRSANNGVKGIVNYMNAQPDVRFSQLGEAFDLSKENFHNQLKGLSNSIKSLSDNAASYSDRINDDLRAVNDQLNVVFNLLADRMVDMENLSIEELYEDVDDDKIDTITTGRTDACTNKGIIKGDINVGGIAGAMSIDEEDPEDSAAGTMDYKIGRRFIMKCLVTDSVNEGYITAKKNGAGGICGYMNHGIIVDSEGYGSVESTEGDYVGGICGESFTIIKNCYALCSVNGNKNVGGIAGYAETLKNCYAMAEVQSMNGRVGAIAGQVASYEEMDIDAQEQGAKVVGNYYVGDDIHGIDDISYIGVAEPISYEDLLTVEQLPTQFWHLKVIYKIEDTYLGSEEVKYGEKLDRLSFPQIPTKEGFYGMWPDVSDQQMRGTFVVEAEYKDNVTVVQSSGDQDDTEEGTWKKPYALVEDIFTEDTILNVKIGDVTPPEEAAGKQSVVYEVTLENGGIKETDSFALRVLNPYEDAVVYGYLDGVWTELESKSRGQYLQVDMTGTQAYFCIVEEKANMMLIVGSIAGAAAAVILLIIIIKKAKALKKKKRQKKE